MVVAAWSRCWRRHRLAPAPRLEPHLQGSRRLSVRRRLRARFGA